MKTFQKWLLLLVCLGLLAGCGRTRPPHGPPVISAIPPPTTESVPDSLEGQPPPDIRRVHAQLFQEAQVNFDGREYPKTISGLKRLLALRPEGTLEEESRWLLAQSYDRVGEWEAARDQYRTLAVSGNGHRYQADAQLKFKEIQRLLEQFRMPPQDTQAIRLTLEQLPASGSFDEGIKKMKEDGITTLLIDLGCQGGGFQSDKNRASSAPHHLRDLQGLLRSYVERSHRLQLLVYVGVNLRCAGNWHDSPIPEWRDRSYNIQTQAFEDNQFFDIFHPDYQRFLFQFLTSLSEDSLDGLVFLDDYPLGVYDGVSPSALSSFQKAFGVLFDPMRVFRSGFDPLSLSKASSGSTRIQEGVAEDSVFWRWLGWKARERLTVFEQLIGHLRQRHLTVQCGLELHPHGLTDPVRALVEYAQDAMEATRRPFSFFFVRPEIDRQSAFDQQAAIEKLRRISTKAVLTRLLPVLDDPRRVWVSMPAERGKRIVPGTGTNGTSPLQDFPSGIGVVHDLRAFS
jgi:predicted small lipoprotein YifL